MDNEKLTAILNKIYDSMNDEQKAEARKCKSGAEFLELVQKSGIELPDELLEGAAGGITKEMVAVLEDAMYKYTPKESKFVNKSILEVGSGWGPIKSGK